MVDKLLGALSLCKKAGKLVVGFDAVAENVAAGTAALVLLAADTSEGTSKRIRGVCESRCECHRLPYTQRELTAITHKLAGVLAITDPDLAALCQKAMADEEEPV